MSSRVVPLWFNAVVSDELVKMLLPDVDTIISAYMADVDNSVMAHTQTLSESATMPPLLYMGTRCWTLLKMQLI